METDCKADTLWETLDNVGDKETDVKAETLRSTIGAIKVEERGFSLVEWLKKIAHERLSDNWQT